MAKFLLKLYERGSGVAQQARLIDEADFDAHDAREAILAAQIRCKAKADQAHFARLADAGHTNVWYADAPFD